MRDPDGYKIKILDSLEKAEKKGLVDEDIIPLLDRINSFDMWVTTSSCSGRFQLISPPFPGDKMGSRILGKWHHGVDQDEILRSIKTWDGRGELHLMVQPVLLHVRCKDLPSGVHLRNIGQGSGLKYSMIRSIKLRRDGGMIPWGITVEMMGTESAEIPLHGIGEDIIREGLPFWTNYGNGLLERTKGHIGDLIGSLEAI